MLPYKVKIKCLYVFLITKLNHFDSFHYQLVRTFSDYLFDLVHVDDEKYSTQVLKVSTGLKEYQFMFGFIFEKLEAENVTTAEFNVD